jgi:hypothetical protein
VYGKHEQQSDHIACHYPQCSAFDIKVSPNTMFPTLVSPLLTLLCYLACQWHCVACAQRLEAISIRRNQGQARARDWATSLHFPSRPIHMPTMIQRVGMFAQGVRVATWAAGHGPRPPAPAGLPARHCVTRMPQRAGCGQAAKRPLSRPRRSPPPLHSPP